MKMRNWFFEKLQRLPIDRDMVKCYNKSMKRKRKIVQLND